MGWHFSHLIFDIILQGYMGGAPNRASGGGSNYLCLPEKPSYSTYKEFRQIDASEIDIQMDSNIYCALCERSGKNSMIMYPGSHQCPEKWDLEYTGTLVTQRQLKRTEYVCLSQEIIPKVSWWRSSLGTTTVSKSACKILPCGEDSNTYRSNKNLNCAVCTQ